MEVLDNLLEIEIAYNLLKGEENNNGVHPIDAQYEKLKADIEVIDEKSEEYKLLEKYVKNTHAATHNQYSLDIDKVIIRILFILSMVSCTKQAVISSHLFLRCLKFADMEKTGNTGRLKSFITENYCGMDHVLQIMLVYFLR